MMATIKITIVIFFDRDNNNAGKTNTSLYRFHLYESLPSTPDDTFAHDPQHDDPIRSL
jgi:hypothetical protein